MKNVLVLGGTGFVGRHLCEHLNRAGIRATVPTRRLHNAQAVQMLPLVQPLEADVHDAATLAQLLPGHDAVVNLIAVLHGSRARFEQVHVELPRRLAAAMQASGVRRLVHVSALGASASGPSDYQRSKAAGEAVLQAAGLELTILRPSVIFGAEDRFLNLFAALQKVFALMPLAGSQARLQPVWVGDVAQALSISDDELMTLQGTRSLVRLYENAPSEVRRIVPADLGLRRIGHFGPFKAEHELGLWPLMQQALHELLQRPVRLGQD